jgi:hypothetical protein
VEVRKKVEVEVVVQRLTKNRHFLITAVLAGLSLSLNGRGVTEVRSGRMQVKDMEVILPEIQARFDRAQ